MAATLGTNPQIYRQNAESFSEASNNMTKTEQKNAGNTCSSATRVVKPSNNYSSKLKDWLTGPSKKTTSLADRLIQTTKKTVQPFQKALVKFMAKHHKEGALDVLRNEIIASRVDRLIQQRVNQMAQKLGDTHQLSPTQIDQLKKGLFKLMNSAKKEVFSQPIPSEKGHKVNINADENILLSNQIKKQLAQYSALDQSLIIGTLLDSDTRERIEGEAEQNHNTTSQTNALIEDEKLTNQENALYQALAEKTYEDAREKARQPEGHQTPLSEVWAFYKKALNDAVQRLESQAPSRAQESKEMMPASDPAPLHDAVKPQPQATESVKPVKTPTPAPYESEMVAIQTYASYRQGTPISSPNDAYPYTLTRIHHDTSAEDHFYRPVMSTFA